MLILNLVMYTVTCGEAWFRDRLVRCADIVTDGLLVEEETLFPSVAAAFPSVRLNSGSRRCDLGEGVPIRLVGENIITLPLPEDNGEGGPGVAIAL